MDEKVCKYCGTIIDSDAITAEDGTVFCDEYCANHEGYYYCAECGNLFPRSSCIEAADGTVFCSDDCAGEHGYMLCENCHEDHPEDDGYCIEGVFYCSIECAASDGWHECERCGEWVQEDDAIHTSDGYWYCDATCAERDRHYRCDRCGEWVHERDTWSVYRDDCRETWCECCADYHATRCVDCGELYDDDEIDCNGYCPECHSDDESEYLHSYGFRPELRFFGGDAWSPKPPMFFGTELETDRGHDRGAYCDELQGIEGYAERFWMTEDSSLDNGVEITSHPMTLAHHIECMPIYEQIGDIARSYGFGSHDGGNCGLHVHVNRSWFGKSTAVQDAGGYKVMRLLQRFERQFMIFSRRMSDNWCHYRTSADYTPKKTVVKILHGYDDSEPSLMEKAERMKHERSHSQCLNFQHSNTYEFRIFRGTLKWTTYFACLGLVDGICRTAVAHGSTWIEDVDWYTLINEIVERCSEKYAKECLVSYLDEKCLR